MAQAAREIWGRDSRVAPFVVLAFGLLLFSINLERPPDPDELHHALAAQQLIETGRPILAEGEYTRGMLHTWMVALSYKVFGEGLASARIPSVLLVALTAPLLFIWVRREAGAVAAWLAAALFISSPFTVEIAQFSRFYSLQMFAFALGAVCVYYALADVMPVSRRALLGMGAAASLGLAIYAQVTTLFGLVGIGVWVMGALIRRVLLNPTASRPAKISLIAVLAVGTALALLAAAFTDAFYVAWDGYRATQLFNLHLQNEFWFYHLRFLLFYSTLWSLVGVIGVLAIVHNPRLAWYTISIFSVSFVLASFAGTKAIRYMSFAPPFLAVVWGVGLAYVAPMLLRFAVATRARLAETFALPRSWGSVSATAVFVVVAVMVLITNPFWLRTATVIGDITIPPDKPNTDWREARDALVSWTSDADIMVTTEELGAIYFLGRSDVLYHPSKHEEIPSNQQFEFGIDHRTGRPVISEPESFERLIECFPRGFVVGPIEHWGDAMLINEDMQTILLEHAEPIEVPAKSHLYAWGWIGKGQRAGSRDCADLSRFSGARNRG